MAGGSEILHARSRFGPTHATEQIDERLTTDNSQFTVVAMIVSFKHRGLQRLYENGDRSGIRADLVEKVERILTVLDAANAPQALDLPGYRLHQLRGNLRGYWSVTVRANWRIIFRFSNGHAQDVDLLDYH
jgi:proteic killer suppression protein